MGSHHSSIGPWPIKRHRSVPDGSIFTPRNSPPSLAELLRGTRTDREIDQQRTDAFQFKRWQGFSDPKSFNVRPMHIHQAKHGAEDRPDRVRNPSRNGKAANFLQPTILLASSAFIVLPGLMIYTFEVQRPREAGDWMRVPIHGPIPLLACLDTTISGFIIGMTVSALGGLKHRNKLRKRSVLVEVLGSLGFGLLLAICMLLFATLLLHIKEIEISTPMMNSTSSTSEAAERYANGM